MFSQPAENPDLRCFDGVCSTVDCDSREDEASELLPSSSRSCLQRRPSRRQALRVLLIASSRSLIARALHVAEISMRMRMRKSTPILCETKRGGLPRFRALGETLILSDNSMKFVREIYMNEKKFFSKSSIVFEVLRSWST